LLMASIFVVGEAPLLIHNCWDLTRGAVLASVVNLWTQTFTILIPPTSRH